MKTRTFLNGCLIVAAFVFLFWLVLGAYQFALR